MRIRRLTILSIVMTSALFAQATSEALVPLHLDEASARRAVLESLTAGSMQASPASAAIRASTPAVRASLVKGFLGWARAYTSTGAFRAAYAQYREQRKPSAPELRGSAGDVLERQSRDQEREFDQMKKNLETLPAEQRQAAEDALRSAREALATADNDPEIREARKQAATQERDEARQRYDAASRKWNQEYPADSRRLIAARLTRFLRESSDVDFMRRSSSGER